MIIPRWRLFPKYATLIIALVAAVLITSGAISIVFSWREIQSHLEALQAEKAQGAAQRIAQYVANIEHELGWSALPPMDGAADPLAQRRFDYLKLLRQVPAITELVWIGADGRERLRVSRLAMDAVNAGTDLSAEPAFVAANAGKTGYGPVQFRKGTEPYMALARPAGSNGGVTLADVNLKFVWDVVSRIKIGESGLAYVVDASGTLIAHPDISLVLKKTDLRGLPQVAALAQPADAPPVRARDLAGQRVLAAHAPIPALAWTVFVESPRAEAFAPLYASILRLGLLLVASLAVAALASFLLARTLVRPIRALQAGAARIGAGELDERIEVHSGDELEALAGQFNQMRADLKASYAGLERKVDERTAALQESLAYQTAISEVLRVISTTPDDVTPVFLDILDSARRLLGAAMSAVFRYDGHEVTLVAARGWTPQAYEDAARHYPGPLNPTMVTGRTLLTRRVQFENDTWRNAQYDQTTAHVGGWRRVMGAPLIKGDEAIGVISVAWPEPGEIPQRQADLLKTFADQAVIAIENVRLFNETREALAQQTATAEVLRVISGSVADTRPVFDKILQSCRKLFDSSEQGIALISPLGEVELAAHQGGTREKLQAIFGTPRPFGHLADAVRQRRALHYADVLNDPDVPEGVREMARRLDIGNYSQVFAPMAWEDRAVGVLYVIRQPATGFSDKEIALLKTFADQAVIAIENARLFHEIDDKSRELAAANQHKSEFLANMSHELRTPLNAIIGFSEVLIERMFGELNDKQADYLKDIHESGRHLLSLINDILDLSKIEAGRMELDLEAFNAADALASALTLVRERAQRHSIALALQVDPLVGEIHADARKFKQILLNLLSNAVKFTPDGGRVTVSAQRQGDWLAVAVSDTGIGIAEADQEAVFEEFRQVGRHYTNKQEGTGLGLALTRRFVALHGGTIGLTSTPGQGSTFTFTLPVAAQALPGLPAPDAAPTAASATQAL